jgi:hypothetical protein
LEIGCFYARGASDDKAMGAALVAIMIQSSFATPTATMCTA